MRGRCLAAVLALALILMVGCAGPPAHAPAPGGCEFEPLSDIPVRMHRNIPLVEARLDGQPVTMVLDTGADRTAFLAAAAKRFELSPDPKRISRLRGVGAPTINFDVRPESFVFGGIDYGGKPFVVASAKFGPGVGINPDGLLGADVLAQYDLELDMPAGRLRLYRARVCPDLGPPWAAASAPIADQMLSGRRIAVPMEINGHSLRGLMDTGSEVTVLGLEAGRRIGLTDAILSRTQGIAGQGVGPDRIAMRVLRFAQLKIGPAVFPYPVLAVAQLPPEALDALIGMDYLLTRRVWISYASARIWAASSPGAERLAQPWRVGPAPSSATDRTGS